MEHLASIQYSSNSADSPTKTLPRNKKTLKCYSENRWQYFLDRIDFSNEFPRVSTAYK